jgi:carbamoyl-phosphate synthase small subunit
MRAAISTIDVDPASLVQRVQDSPRMEGADLARTVSAAQAYEAATLVGPVDRSHGTVFRIAAYDYGMKRNILRRLAGTGCETTVFPAETPAAEIAAGGFDGVFLSNGPGDPAVTAYGIAAVRGLIGKVPIFGICLGHQLLALALGGRTFKMRFGHRGVNQPVKNLDTGRVEITSQNHGFAVDRASLEAQGGVDPMAETDYGDAELTHWNLNDGTLEGLRCVDVPAFSCSTTPRRRRTHDSRYLFQDFRALMEHS